MPTPKAFGLEAGTPGLAGTQIGTTSDGRPIIAWPASSTVNEVLDPIEGDPADSDWTGDTGQVDGGGDPSPGNGGESWTSSGAGSLTNDDESLAAPGDRVCSWVQSDTGNTVGMWFGVTDGSNCYYVYFTPSTPELRIGKYVDGAGTDFESMTAFSVSDPTNWFLLELSWYDDGTMEAAVKPDHETDALATVSGSDSTYTSGGVGVEFTEAGQNFDHFQRCGEAIRYVPSSAVHHWRYDEGTGTTAADNIGTADGTINGPAWISGDWLGEYALDASALGDHVDKGTLPNWAGGLDTDVAIALTVQTTDTGYMLGSADTSPDGSCVARTGIRTNGGDVNFNVTDQDDFTLEAHTDPGLVDEGAKHRIVMNKTSNDASGLEVYVDGQKEPLTVVFDEAYNWTRSELSFPLYQFARNLDGSVDGELDSNQDSVIFCDSALTETEVQDDYEQQPYGFRVQDSFDEQAMFGKVGHVGLKGFVDVDGDGKKEFICNIGSEADFAAINLDNGTVEWRSTQNTTKGKMAYFPQVVDGDSALAYGHRANDTVYCINLSDGSVRWTYQANGSLQSLEQADAGLVVGSNGTGGEVTVLDYADGSQLAGWPVAFSQHEQLLGAGDLDGDGQDEIVMNDNSGNIEVRNRDGSLRFSLSSSHGHSDLCTIGDIHPTHTGNELLVVVDDDGSVTGSEGDELAMYDMDGVQLEKYTFSESNPSYSVDDFLPNQDGLEVAYGLENSDEVGLLDGTLTSQWTTTVASHRIGSGALGQVGSGDFDGDGELEIIANADETEGAGVLVFDASGNLRRKRTQAGWDIDTQAHLRNAAIGSFTFIDFDGDGRAEYYASRSAASDTTINDRIDISTLHP